MDRPLRLQRNEIANGRLHLHQWEAAVCDEQNILDAKTPQQTARTTRFAKTKRFQSEKRVRLTGATPIMIALLFYCFYLSISYTQPIHWELDVAPYRVHLQTDEVERLELLPGIGPIMAQKIAEFRIDHPIESPDDLTEIHGIGQKTVNQLRRLTTSKPNHED
jgi:DNA uptake protein ComE-like DNA-binding protein